MTLEQTVGKGTKRVTIKGLVRQLLLERYEAVRANPDLKINDRWTLSTVFYRVRPRILEHGLHMSDTIRDTIEYEYVNDICTREIGVRRRHLGIFAAVRAQLYFRGEVYNVVLEDVDALAGKGTDMIVIEKEAIADIMAPFAAKIGIAILNPRGFLSENAEELSYFARTRGGNVAVLTDYDSSGIAISYQVERTYRLGVDPSMVHSLGIDQSRVEEGCSKTNHWKWLARHHSRQDLEYLENHRIEIDSVLAEVGAEALWKYIQDKLAAQFPHRDYNRAIEIPDYTEPDVIDHFTSLLADKQAECVVTLNKTIKRELQDVEGFLVVEEKEADIETRQIAEIEEDPTLGEVMTKLRELASWLEQQNREADSSE